jgi:hypothetical protein
MKLADIRSRFEPGDRVTIHVSESPSDGIQQDVYLKGTFLFWDERYRASPDTALVNLDVPDQVSGRALVSVDYRRLERINALDRLVDEL